MTLRQKILKRFYSLFLTYQKFRGKQKILYNGKNQQPGTSFYSLSVELNNGASLPFEKLKGKKVLLVNTASDCGYTPQYQELQQLYQHSKEDLQIIAFPANDFKNQETKTDKEIETFCTVNFGVRFPLAKKAHVLKDDAQHPVFQWLTHKEQNGWNDQPPTWNFSKYLVDENGVLTHYFDPAVSPMSEEVIKAVHYA